MSYALALVDFDGTLADSMPYWLSLPKDALREAGIPEPEGFDAYIRSVPMHEIAADMAKKYPAVEAECPFLQRFDAQMRAHYAEHVPLKPGADGLLRLLHRANIRICILSATRHELLDAVAERLGVTALADGIYTEAEAGSKRTEAPYAYFRDTFGVPYGKMLLIEDAPRNLAAAKTLGLTTVGVYDESMKNENAAVRATSQIYLPDFSDLTALEELLQ